MFILFIIMKNIYEYTISRRKRAICRKVPFIVLPICMAAGLSATCLRC